MTEQANNKEKHGEEQQAAVLKLNLFREDSFWSFQSKVNLTGALLKKGKADFEQRDIRTKPKKNGLHYRIKNFFGISKTLVIQKSKNTWELSGVDPVAIYVAVVAAKDAHFKSITIESENTDFIAASMVYAISLGLKVTNPMTEEIQELMKDYGHTNHTIAGHKKPEENEVKATDTNQTQEAQSKPTTPQTGTDAVATKLSDTQMTNHGQTPDHDPDIPSILLDVYRGELHACSQGEQGPFPLLENYKDEASLLNAYNEAPENFKNFTRKYPSDASPSEPDHNNFKRSR